MTVGEKGFTYYRALCFTEGKIPYLDTGMRLYKRPSSAKGLPIQRTGSKRSNYDINIASVRYQWEILEYPFENEDWKLNQDIVRLKYNNRSSDTQDKRRKKKPLSLQEQLDSAVAKENFEAAAKLRDKMKTNSQKKES